MTLRRRLIAIQVALVTLGLVVFAVVSYQLYSRSLYQRVDNQLRSASPLLTSFLADNRPDENHPPGGQGPPGDGVGPNNLPPGSFVALRNAQGRAIAGEQHQIPCYGATSCPEPSLPLLLSAPGSAGGRLFTTGAAGASGSFRVLAQRADRLPPFAGNDTLAGDSIVTAIPQSDVTRSLHRLLIVDVAAGLAVLLVLSVAGLLVVRRGLRPLEEMAITAGAVASGDLSRRAEPADPRSEVGRLSVAFNTMMVNIEDAFSARDATEARLRQFLADASHELRTPLTSIRGYAELYRLGAAASAEELETVMARIEQHAIEMGGLVEELLLLARLDQTRTPERQPLDLAVLASEACSDALVIAAARPLTLDAPKPAPIVGDAAHLRQAVTNLLTNAVRHTPDGTSIEVVVHPHNSDGVITVRDHGAGLSPDGLVHAFDRFWRADRARTGIGNGLGLAIVAAVAAEHGGTAAVCNEADGGARFTLTIPLAPTPLAP